MKVLTYILFLFATVFSNTAHAKNTIYGIGVSVASNATLYAPIDTQQFLFEPSIALRILDRKSGSKSTTRSLSRNHYDIGVGIFKKSTLTSKTTAYYGARIGHYLNKYKDNNSDSSTIDEQSEFYITPTFGAEYFLSLKFSIALDFSVKYSFGTDKSSTNGTEDSKIKTSSLGTNTEIIIRYHF